MPLSTSGGSGSGKPPGGWSRDDFLLDVRDSLTKADNSLQPSLRGAANGLATLGADGLLTLAQRPAGLGGTQPLLHITTSRTLTNNDRSAFTGIRCENSADITVTIPEDSDGWTMQEGDSLLLSRAGTGGVLIAPGGTAASSIGIVGGNATAFNSTTGTSYAVPMPGGILNGHTVTVTLAVPTQNPTWTIPSGFTQVGANVGVSGASLAVFIANNVLASNFGSGVTKTWTSSVGAPAVAIVEVFNNVSTTAPVDVFVGSSGSTGTTPAATAATQFALELGIKMAGTTNVQGAAPEPPPELTLMHSGATAVSTPNVQLTVARGSSSLPAGASIGNRAFTKPDASSNYGTTATFALAPTTTAAVTINSESGQRRIGARYRSVVLTKVGANQYDLEGTLSA